MTALETVLPEELSTWPGPAPSAAVLVGPGDVVASGREEGYAWASVTKLLTSLLVLDAVARAELSLDESAGPPGATVRHLLAHASGLSLDSDRVLAAPGLRRIYSNRGFDLLGELAADRAGTDFPTLVEQRVLAPLGMRRTVCAGSPAHGAHGPLEDLVLLARELLWPHHFSSELIESARQTVFPGLTGVLPGFGRQEPNDWGLGFEVRGAKDPHWTSPLNSAETFGHFGQAGVFVWVDPVHEIAAVAATDAPFGPWAASAWPRFSTRALRTILDGRGGSGSQEEAP